MCVSDAPPNRFPHYDKSLLEKAYCVKNTGNAWGSDLSCKAGTKGGGVNFGQGDVITVEIDFDARTVSFDKNGESMCEVIRHRL